MEDDEDKPPFWLQSTTHHRRRRHQVSSFFLSSGVLLVLLLVVAFFLVFVIVPSFVSFTSQIFRPHLVKKSWDSLNLVLVIFAIVCGFLNIKTNNGNNETPRQGYYREQSLSNNVKQDRTPRSYPETSPRWYDQFQQDRTPKLSRLRSFSSYPDLRQESSWISNDERWRFYDDTHINNYRLSSSDQLNPDPPLDQETKKPQVLQEVSAETKDITVDTVVSSQDKEVIYLPTSPPPPAPPSPPPQSPPGRPPQSSTVVKKKVKRTYQDVEKSYPRIQENKLEEVETFYIRPPSPPPAPPPPVYGKNEKRRGKDFLISLSRRKKKQRQKSVENLESFFNLETSLPSLIPPPSTPPPPAPPPPPHFLQNIFSSKKGKTKKTHNANLAPPPPNPPPPPPPRTVVKTRLETRASVLKPQISPVITTQKSPKSLRTKIIEENTESGNASPLIPIPAPPPPPPFKVPAWKFVVDGDYVRVGSFNSSRSGSPDIEENSDKELSPMSGGEGLAKSIFCPSPDVNMKADKFIARFRAGLRTEKNNSIKGRSNLGLEGTSGETEE